MRTRILTGVVVLLLCLTLSFSLCACKDTAATTDAPTQAATEAIDLLWESATYLEDVTLGEGKTTINVVVEAGERSITVTINTDADNLEDALTGVDLVQGEQSEYGLFIKTVNGITADYDTDGAYWSINKDGEYLMTGADDTEIADGDSFELVYTK